MLEKWLILKAFLFIFGNLVGSLKKTSYLEEEETYEDKKRLREEKRKKEEESMYVS